MNKVEDRKRLLLGRALALVWKSSRGLTAGSVLLTVLQGLLPLVPLYLMKLLIDSLEQAIGGGTVTFGRVALLIGLMGGAALFSSAVSSVASIVGQIQSRVVTDYMQDILHRQSVSVDMSYYEDHRFYDSLHRAQQEAPYRPTGIVNDLVMALRNTISLLAMVGLLLSFHWSVALVLAVAALPGVLVKLKFSKVLWRWRRRRTETERMAWYKHWLLTSVEHAKELRLFGLGPHFRRRYRELRELLRQEAVSIAKRRAAADLGTQTVATVLVYGSLAFIAWRTFRGLISLGSMVMYFQAFRQGLGYLRGLLGNLANLYEGNLFLGNLFEFLDMTSSVVDPPRPVPFPSPMTGGIRLNNVSFSYPSEDRKAVDDVSLDINRGEMLALVGQNGSGKTTLVKLICRLYDADSGCISMGGIPLPDFSVDELRSNVSVLFQDYARYHLSAAENISLGDIRRPPEESAVIEAAETAGAHRLISGMPGGYDTVLGRWFRGGRELSAGEWQKIALARTFYRLSPVLILDEPTSALDAEAEEDLFLRFREFARGRTSLVISHRFSTVRMADRIAVMDRGRLVETGTHDELVELGGTYSRMYKIQAGSYR